MRSDFISQKNSVDEIRQHFESKFKKKDKEADKFRNDITLHFESKLKEKDAEIDKLSKQIQSVETWRLQLLQLSSLREPLLMCKGNYDHNQIDE